MPKFADELAWQQAELLMQPIYIRILDRIRQQSELTTWEVCYEAVQIPQPTNYLCLRSGDRQFRYDLWDLCYQVCFVDYHGSHGELEPRTVVVDTSLINLANHSPDWHQIDTKAQATIAHIFDSLK